MRTTAITSQLETLKDGNVNDERRIVLKGLNNDVVLNVECSAFVCLLFLLPFLLLWLYENGLKQTDAPMGGSADESSAEEEYAVEKNDGVVELLDMSKELVQRSRGLDTCLIRGVEVRTRAQTLLIYKPHSTIQQFESKVSEISERTTIPEPEFCLDYLPNPNQLEIPLFASAVFLSTVLSKLSAVAWSSFFVSFLVLSNWDAVSSLSFSNLASASLTLELMVLSTS